MPCLSTYLLCQAKENFYVKGDNKLYGREVRLFFSVLNWLLQGIISDTYTSNLLSYFMESIG